MREDILMHQAEIMVMYEHLKEQDRAKINAMNSIFSGMDPENK